MTAAGAAGVDPRLDQRVQHQQRGESLASGLARLSEASGVPHLAEAPQGARGLVALNVLMPLRELHGALADLYARSWEGDPATGGYILRRTEADQGAHRRAEQAWKQLRREEVLARWEPLRQLALWPRQEVLAMAAQGDPRAQQMRHPLAGQMFRLAATLPDAFWREALDGGYPRMMLRDISPEAVRFGQSITLGPLPLDVVAEHGFVSLGLGGTPLRPTMWMLVRTRADGVFQNLLYREPNDTFLGPRERRPDAEQSPSSVPKDEPFRARLTLRDPAISREPNPRRRPAGAKPLTLLLEELSKQTGVPILADCDYQPENLDWLRQQWWLGAEIENEPLPRALDLLCSDFEYEWRFERGALLLRSRLWFMDEVEARRRYVYPEKELMGNAAPLGR